jgi:hypothetical protein
MHYKERKMHWEVRVTISLGKVAYARLLQCKISFYCFQEYHVIKNV